MTKCTCGKQYPIAIRYGCFYHVGNNYYNGYTICPACERMTYYAGVQLEEEDND